MRKRAPLFARPHGLADEPHWYKDAIIYELRVRSFQDSNSDGIGDFRGLTEKLDYLADLGVTALWLLPFYPSPGRDDGYDISDYANVHEEVGTLDDFKEFLEEAHRRGLRVITELVLNHTSEAHPWFQRARRAPIGSPERNFYVWNDTPEKYKDARIIFQDFEPSNWSWDPIAKQYYWHRFFAHQPDLNFANPAVHEAMFSAVDFWFGMGVDGLRLDAVPYLYERDDTNCENLPETHAFLKKLRKHVDEKFKNRMLLAEANQWPEDAAAYFGDGDECHMNFHFPIMPRIFMSIHMEDRLPLIDILAQTPHLHDTCQWAMFLRNHDELTLEMVTDEERDYMVRAYAAEPAMRLNLGIRRRLAPLLGNDRRTMELMNALLCSLPGTPVLYYGDEIGMGDNVYLGDRNGVRTPMQWSSDRNGGFSRANPQRLILPVIIDPEYHFESLNVEAQQLNPTSLLWWTKRLIGLRKRFQAFGRGNIEFLHPDNPRVLAFTRHYEDETILVVANLSRNVQYVELDLHPHKGLTPVELFGGTSFPVIGDLPYLLTLGEHGFYWFSLSKTANAEGDAREAAYQPPALTVTGGWKSLLAVPQRAQLEEVLTNYLEGRRWFRAHGRQVAGATIVEDVSFTDDYHLFFLRIEFSDGEPETYVVPVAFSEDLGGELRARSPQAILATVAGDSRGLLYDPLADVPSSMPMLQAVVDQKKLKGLAGEVIATAFQPLDAAGLDARSIKPEHPNAIVIYGNKYLLKMFRRLDEGIRPPLEIGRYLHKRNAPVPKLVGALEYRGRRGEPITVATLHEYLPAEGDGWEHAREEVARYYARMLTQAEVPTVPEASPYQLSETEPPQAVRDLLGAWLDQAKLLGQRTAELHAALVDESDPAFAPEPYSALDQRSLYQAMRNIAGNVLRQLRAATPSLPAPVAKEAQALITRADDLYKQFEPLLATKLTAVRTRRHGDYHLGSVLFTGRDFALIDFDGRFGRPLPERRRKRSALRDAASMMRSLQHVAFSTLLDPSVVREADRERARPWAWLWYVWSAAAFLHGYFEVADTLPFLPRDKTETEMLLDLFLVERTLKDLGGTLAAGQPQAAVVLEFLVRQLA